MKIISSTGRDNIATVYLASLRDNKVVEFLESVQPPLPREKKWVLIVSTLFGCPVQCPICDAGGFYEGKLTKDEILAQIQFLVHKHYPDNIIPAEKFKIQFARMGEPSFNDAVLDLLEELPERFNAPGLMPCLSSVAPKKCGPFFERLLEIKERLYHGNFQLQFSLHSTDPAERDYLIPVKKWSFEQMAEYGARFFQQGDRKITLNFAPAVNSTIDPAVLKDCFDPDIFLVKITPLNPTYRAEENQMTGLINPYGKDESYDLIENLRSLGYEVLLSIGENEENRIGSNCGQYITRHLKEQKQNRNLKDGYSYRLDKYAAAD